MVDGRKVPEGYKVTEVGVIPEDWDSLNVKDLVSFSGGSQPPKSTFRREKRPGYIRLIQIRDYKNDDYLTFIPEMLANKKCSVDDIMIGRYGPPIFQILRGIDGAYNVALMKALPNEKLEKEYLYYFLKQESLFRFIELLSRRSSGQTGVDLVALREYPFPLPPLHEQKAIAEALSDTDNLIKSIEKLIDKKKKIKQGVMQRLLTGKKRLPGFSGEWEVKRLGEIGEFSGAGIDKKINADEEKVRLLNFLDVYHKDFIYSNDLWHEVTAPKYKAEKCSIKRGDVFFTPSSELRTDIALSAVAMEDIDDAVYSYHVVRYRFYDEWDIHFKTYIFNTRFFFSQAETMCEGSGKRYVISLKKFKELEIMYPIDLREQKAIAQILSDMDAEIEALNKKLEKYKTIKQGMMQELLTGRIRLI